MKQRWHSGDFDPSERAEALRDLLWSSVVRIEVDHHVDIDAVDTRMALGSIGSLGLLSVRSTAATVRRTARLAEADEEPAIFVGVQLSSSSVVVQDGREATLRTGDFVIYDTSRPYTLLFDEGIDQHFIRIPRAELALPEHVISSATAVVMGRDHPVAALASSYLTRLVGSDDLVTGPFADDIARPTVELIRSVITTRAGDDRLGSEPLRESLAVRALEYARAHLGDPDLSAETIARSQNVSVRTLYSALAEAGVGLGDWIRRRRLEACRRDLADPRYSSTNIAVLASRWGFADGPHFSRTFKKTYGMAPSEWRALAAQSPHGSTTGLH